MSTKFSAEKPMNPADLRRRNLFTIATLATTVGLIGWGGFVTSIDAGLAVPDWPSSFGSYDPLNPWPEWWNIVPVLAEHGHRLMGMVVGFFTLILAGWTLIADKRSLLRKAAILALVLVITQGILGGLRVVLVSLNLAMVHTMTAQLFFASLFALIAFSSKDWHKPLTTSQSDEDVKKVKRLTLYTAGAVYFQIMLGALLRHPGVGIDPILVTLHILGATLATTMIFIAGRRIKNTFSDVKPLQFTTRIIYILVMTQVMLGLTAYFVLLDEQGVMQPSNLQVVVNTVHLIIGALLFGFTAYQAIWAYKLTSRTNSMTLESNSSGSTEQSTLVAS